MVEFAEYRCGRLPGDDVTEGDVADSDEWGGELRVFSGVAVGICADGDDVKKFIW